MVNVPKDIERICNNIVEEYRKMGISITKTAALRIAISKDWRFDGKWKPI